MSTRGLPRDPPDLDTGPPWVTCDAWAAIDLASGEPIIGSQIHRTLPMASTTKIMTAWLVFRLATETPAVLDETLTYSRRADRTRGSTSTIREGESLPVRDALFGLLLPSGNDASIALAEHFGARAIRMVDEFADPQPGDDPLSLFVTAMNREAARLALINTHYVNPHGLDNDNHHTSALDLARLATVALSDPLFEEYVNTRIHGCRVTGRSGYTRNIVWYNTNRLLGTEGYAGVKTGTTSKAGACLVSVSDRYGRQIVLAVLGSVASPARYTDSRNLHRWLRQLRTTPADVP